MFPLHPEDGQYLGQARRVSVFQPTAMITGCVACSTQLALGQGRTPTLTQIQQASRLGTRVCFDKKISFHKSRPAVPHGVLSDKVISKSCTPTPHLHIQQLT